MAVVSEIVSLLPKLEPILGATFALNLAYIALPRFRYRETIRNYTNEKIHSEFQGDIKDLEELDFFKPLMWLAGLNDTPEKGVENGCPPNQIWAKIYKRLYANHFDRGIAIVLSVSCFILLINGVAHEINYLKFSKCVFTISHIHWWIWSIAFGALLPCINVTLGGYFVKSARDFTNESIQSHLQSKQSAVKHVVLPVNGD